MNTSFPVLRISTVLRFGLTIIVFLISISLLSQIWEDGIPSVSNGEPLTAIYSVYFKFVVLIVLITLIFLPHSGQRIICANLLLFYLLAVILDLGLVCYMRSMAPELEIDGGAGKTGLSLVEQLRRDNILAFLTGGPSYEFTKTTLVKEQLVPFAGVSSSFFVFCTESSGTIFYRSDRYGFRNPDDIWNPDNIGKPVVLLGDSYGQGACVNEPYSIAGNLRIKYPVLNLSVSGSGPYEMLAILKEYVPEVTSSLIIWLFYAGNDVGNLRNTMPEATVDIGLDAYLEKGYSQKLVKRQNEIDRLISTGFEAQYAMRQRDSQETAPSSLINWSELMPSLLLENIARTLWRGALPYEQFEYEKEVWEKFSDILSEAQRTAQVNKSKLVFVVLHPVHSHKASWFSKGRLALADNAIRIARSLDIPAYDTFDLVHNLESGADSAYAFGDAGGHHNELGYEVVAKGIHQMIDQEISK